MHRMPDGDHIGESKGGAYFHELRRTPKSNDANEDEALHAIDECFLQKGGKPCGCRCPSLYALQFCRVHQTLRVTPAMEAGVTGHVWTLEEVVALLDRRILEAAA